MIVFFIIIGLIAFFTLFNFISSYREMSAELSEYRNKDSRHNQLMKDEKNEIEKKKKEIDHLFREAEHKEKAVLKKEAYYSDAIQTLDKLIEDRCNCYPHMAAIMADLLTVHYERSAKYLTEKKRPAYDEAYRIRELREETREIIKEKKLLEYTLTEIKNGSLVLDTHQKRETLPEERERLQSEFGDISTENERLRSEINNARLENERLRSEIDSTISENERLRSTINAWQEEASRAKEIVGSSLPKALIGDDLFNQYLQSMSTTRLERSLSEEMQFRIPFDLSTTILSSSGARYTTSLTNCTCEDFKRNNRPCKHMLALAIKANALAPYEKQLEKTISQMYTIAQRTSEKEALIKEEQKSIEKAKKELSVIEKFIAEKQQSYPWLAQLISSYRTAKYDVRIRSTVDKQKLTAEIKRSEKEKALLANQLAVYEYMFPILNAFKELPPDSIISNLSDAKDTGFNYNWLSEEEYKILTSAEKQQLWIRNYFERRSKNAWEAGIKYERYIGYRCELEGCTVKYTGALLKLNDMGRDLIARKGNTIYIIQCKRYSESKEIHENHLFQLFGSTCHYAAEHPNKKVVGIFVTTSRLSDVARECANKLDIILYENTEFKEYPIIKCNIGKNGDKIYHLPFDQQYDNVTIKAGSDEMYVSTIEEAEHLGFRHAMKHKFIS